MRIALFTIAGSWGGTEIHAAHFLRTLRARGHDAKIVCLTTETFNEYRRRCQNSEHIVCKSTPKIWWRMGFWDWLRFFRKQKWDAGILIKGWFELGHWKLDLAARCCFGNYLTIEQLMAKPIPARTSRYRFGVIRGLGLWWYRSWVLPRYQRSIGPRKVVCVSDAVRRRLVCDFRFSSRKAVTVRNGIDVQRFQRNADAGQCWRERWEIPTDALVFGAVGRLSAVKGFDVALRAFRMFLDSVPGSDARFVLVGEGDKAFALKAMAKRGLPCERVIFSPFCDRPWEALSAIDVFVMPSRNEGLPFALLEAMACNCCPIATAAAGIPEVLPNSELGWLVPVNDVRAFAAAMIDVATRSAGDRAAMGLRARQHVMRHFNATTQLNRLAEIVELLARSGPMRLRNRSQIGTRKSWAT